MGRTLVFYHYFYPDDVVSAVLFSELAAYLQEKGCQVTAMPSNRASNDETIAYPLREKWRGIEIRRIWRPGFHQPSTFGRLVNAAWMNIAWSLQAVIQRNVSTVIIGTDPVLSIVVAIVWRFFHPKVMLVHWCFDLYPEAALADNLLRRGGVLLRCLKAVVRLGYARCDLLADIGPCMALKLKDYRSGALRQTLNPWALTEPGAPVECDPAERERLFPGSRLCVLYSGTFGRAHTFAEILQLARRVREDGIAFGFAVRGSRVDELRRALGKADTNIRLLPFALQDRLERQLSLGDVHIASLRSEWTGAVVPSKFFGSLAVGRPVLFSGHPDASIAQWVREYEVGWVLTPDTIEEVATTLRHLAHNRSELAAIFQHCQDVYRTQFARRLVLDRWAALVPPTG